MSFEKYKTNKLTFYFEEFDLEHSAATLIGLVFGALGKFFESAKWL